MPDFFHEKPAKMEWYQPVNDEQKALVGEWFKDALWSIDAEDGAKAKIPIKSLAPSDEPAETVKAYEESFNTLNYVERVDYQIHGFMSACANLNNDRVKAEYERGYQLALKFFHKHP